MRIPVKKLLLVLITVVLLLSGCARKGKDEPADNAAGTEESAVVPDNLSESDIIGVWELTSIIMDGQKLSPVLTGVNIRYEFREDHVAHGIFAGNLGERGEAKEPWTLNTDQALIYVSGKPFLKVRSEDGTLFLLMDEEVSVEAAGSQVFTRVENP